MSYNDLLCLSALPLQQVNAVLESLQQYLPTFPLGAQVINVDENERFIWITVGTVCGFDYINHPDFDCGWYYQVNPQFSQIHYKDGGVTTHKSGSVFGIPEENLQLVDNNLEIA